MSEDTSRSEHDQRIDYVEFASSDLELTKQFYQAVFGWTFQDWGQDYSSFKDGRLDGGFYRNLDITPTEIANPLVILYAVDLEATQANVEQAGGTICKPIFAFPGGRRFEFKDPTGNILGVWSDQEAVVQVDTTAKSLKTNQGNSKTSDSDVVSF